MNKFTQAEVAAIIKRVEAKDNHRFRIIFTLARADVSGRVEFVDICNRQTLDEICNAPRFFFHFKAVYASEAQRCLPNWFAMLPR